MNLGLLTFRMVGAAALLKGDKEDVDGRLVNPMPSSEAPRSLRASWSGQNCTWMRRGERARS